MTFSSTKTMSIRYLLICRDKNKKGGGSEGGPALIFLLQHSKTRIEITLRPSFLVQTTCWILEGIRAKRNKVQETRMSSVIFVLFQKLAHENSHACKEEKQLILVLARKKILFLL